MSSCFQTTWRAGLILLVLAIPLGIGGTATATDPAPAGATEATPAGGEGARQIVVYYFHGNRRCATCRKIESLSEEVVDSWYREQLRSGELTWKVVNYEEPEHQHFVEKFGLFSATLAVAEIRDGETVRQEVLQKVWTLVRDETEFERYVRQALDRYLDG